VPVVRADCSRHDHQEEHAHDCACHQSRSALNVSRRQLLWSAAGVSLAAQTNLPATAAGAPAGKTQYSADGMCFNAAQYRKLSPRRCLLHLLHDCHVVRSHCNCVILSTTVKFCRGLVSTSCVCIFGTMLFVCCSSEFVTANVVLRRCQCRRQMQRVCRHRCRTM